MQVRDCRLLLIFGFSYIPVRNYIILMPRLSCLKEVFRIKLNSSITKYTKTSMARLKAGEIFEN
jgi:hypothetical protein